MSLSIWHSSGPTLFNRFWFAMAKSNKSVFAKGSSTKPVSKSKNDEQASRLCVHFGRGSPMFTIETLWRDSSHVPFSCHTSHRFSFPCDLLQTVNTPRNRQISSGLFQQRLSWTFQRGGLSRQMRPWTLLTMLRSSRSVHSYIIWAASLAIVGHETPMGTLF